MSTPLSAANLKDLLTSQLTAQAKLLALWLAAEGPMSRDDCGKALRMYNHEVEAACRDLSSPRVRWMPVLFDSGRLDLVDDCPIKDLFKRPKKKDPSNA